MNVAKILSEVSRKISSKKHVTKSGKSRVKVYDSINKALEQGSMGQIFSTNKANRLYVLTKHKWGKSGQQTVGGKTAKGFTPGSATPGAGWKDIKGYAVRTMAKHGGKQKKAISGGRYLKKNKKEGK
tara:strand:- start:990 stop:1370 length:381 start_codon:yes stop_codon:yes gene_type:complete